MEPVGGPNRPASLCPTAAGCARSCTKRDSYPEGRGFVGTGVIWDVELHPTQGGISGGPPCTACQCQDWALVLASIAAHCPPCPFPPCLPFVSVLSSFRNTLTQQGPKWGRCGVPDGWTRAYRVGHTSDERGVPL